MIAIRGRARAGTFGRDNVNALDEICIPGLACDALTKFRALVAREHFLGADRMDTMLAAKGSHDARGPEAGGFGACSNGYPSIWVGLPRLVASFECPGVPDGILTWTGIDWASRARTRSSTSVGCGMHGKRHIKAWSRTQALVAPSSAEA